MSERRQTFQLVPRRRVLGVRVGGMRSARRGSGYDVATSRPYRPGDDVRRIDRSASARLSSATGRDEFIVREHFSEEAAHVVVAVDGRPTMALYPDAFPWLHKPGAVAEAYRLIADSALEARCPVHRVAEPSPDGLGPTLEALVAERRRLQPGTFVFLLSDFLALPSEDAWAGAFEAQWDLVPVLIQDPVWEQSFPDAGGAVLPLADPETGRVRLVRMRRAEARARREENEARLATILERFAELGLTPVGLSRHDAGSVHAAFVEWAGVRRRGRSAR